MKRKTALKNLSTIIERLNICNGKFNLDGYDFEGLTVKKAYVFGSLVKMSDFPNDIDILIDYERFGKFHAGRYLRGLVIENRVFINLRKGMKMIRFHDFRIDGNYNDIPDTKVMIFPDNNFNK